MKTNHLLRYSKLIIFVSIIFVPVYYFLCCRIPDKTDYTKDIIAAKGLLNGDIYSLMPHFIFEVLLIVAHVVCRLSYNISSLVIVMLFQYFVAIVIFNVLNRRFQFLTDTLLTAITISLLLVFAIPLMVLADHEVYMGYFVANVYHNPTVIVEKPFAILLSLSAAGIFIKEKNNKHALFYTMLLTVLSIFAKPNYIMVLLPTLALMVSVSIVKKEYINWKLLFGGIVVISIIVLALQFALRYLLQANASGGEKSHIIFAPFTVIGHYSGWLFIKLLLSVAFPLFLTIAYFKEMIKDKVMQLAWASFLVSLLFSYFIAETGPFMYDGNFVWGSEITLFLLFFYSMIFMIQKVADGGIKDLQMLMKDKKILPASLIYLCHFASGILYYGTRFFL